MKDIFIRPKAIRDLKFPFTLVVGKIGKIEVRQNDRFKFHIPKKNKNKNYFIYSHAYF
jgi:hypothetical protein